MRLRLALAAVSALLLAGPASARDTVQHIPLADVLDMRPPDFECHAGAFVIGVALKGTYAKVER